MSHRERPRLYRGVTAAPIDRAGSEVAIQTRSSAAGMPPEPGIGGTDPLAGPGAAKGIPDATVARLPVYLRALAAVAERGVDTISSGALAEAAGVTSAQLRKDLSYLGS